MPEIHTAVYGGLGRREPTDWKHVEKYPARVALGAKAVDTVEETLYLPRYRHQYNQGRAGACGGYGGSWMMSMFNRKFYNARMLWQEARMIDEWSDNDDLDDDGPGTSMRAIFDVLRTKGHAPIVRGKTKPWDINEGINANRWATSVDEIRTAIEDGSPVGCGIPWYSSYYHPVKVKNEWWIGRHDTGDLGRIEGGHFITAYGASDKRQALKLMNTWGIQYPPVWLPYSRAEMMLNQNAEFVIVTDR